MFEFLGEAFKKWDLEKTFDSYKILSRYKIMRLTKFNKRSEVSLIDFKINKSHLMLKDNIDVNGYDELLEMNRIYHLTHLGLQVPYIINPKTCQIFGYNQAESKNTKINFKMNIRANKSVQAGSNDNSHFTCESYTKPNRFVVLKSKFNKVLIKKQMDGLHGMAAGGYTVDHISPRYVAFTSIDFQLKIVNRLLWDLYSKKMYKLNDRTSTFHNKFLGSHKVQNPRFIYAWNLSYPKPENYRISLDCFVKKTDKNVKMKSMYRVDGNKAIDLINKKRILI